LKKIFLNFSLLAFSLCTFASPPKISNGYGLLTYIQKIKDKELIHNIRMISYKGSPNRFFGTTGHEKIQELLDKTLKSFNSDESITFETQNFLPNVEVGKKFFQDDFDQKIKANFTADSPEFKKWNSFNMYMQKLVVSKKDKVGKNFIWSKKGKSTKTIVLTAHYDTISHQKEGLKVNEKEKMPGADFNASGVSLLLSLIKLIAPLELENTVKIVFLDAQSIGYLGSYEYAQKLKNSSLDIQGVINFEMLGHDSKVLDKEKKLNNFKVYMRDQRSDQEHLDERLYKSFTFLSKKMGGIIKFEPTKNNFKKSDQFRFWEANIPSIVFTQNWESDFNPRFQTPNDFPETINLKTFNFAFRSIALSTIGYLLDLKR